MNPEKRAGLLGFTARDVHLPVGGGESPPFATCRRGREAILT